MHPLRFFNFFRLCFMTCGDNVGGIRARYVLKHNGYDHGPAFVLHYIFDNPITTILIWSENQKNGQALVTVCLKRQPAFPGWTRLQVAGCLPAVLR